MINRLPISLEGIPPNAVTERARQLLKAGCPTYSTAWYQAYGELLHVTVQPAPSDASSQPAVAESQAVDVFIPLQPQVMRQEVPLTVDELLARVRASEKLGRPAVPSKQPSPNSVAEVLAADELDFDALSAYLSVRAVMAYGDEQEVKDELEAERAQHVDYFHEGRTAAFGYTLHKHAFLAFRGTVSAGEFCLTDMNIIPWSLPLRHLGFNRAWRKVKGRITAWLDALPEDSRRLVLTGHSLGGALAVLAAFDLAKQYQYSIRAVITFGAPRVGLPRFRHEYHVKRCGGETLHAVTRRYTHETDLVSRIPPAVLYCHVGDESVVYSSGAIEKGRPIGLVARFEEFLESSPLKQAPKPGLVSLPPVPPKPPESLPRDQRTKLAGWKFIQQLKAFVPMIMHDSSMQLLWIASSGIGILLCAAAWQDVLRHHSGKYVKAFEKKYPRLTQRRDYVSGLIDRTLDAPLTKINPPWNQA